MDRSLIVTLALLTASLVYLATRLFRPRPIPGIPHNPINNPLGDAFATLRSLRKDGDVFEDGSILPRMIRALGPIAQLLVGTTTVVLVCDVQEYEDALLRSRSKYFRSANTTQRLISMVMPEGMIALTNDDQCRRHRRMIAPLMGSKYLSGMASGIAENAQILIEYWKRKTQVTADVGGHCFMCSGDLEATTLDTISGMVIGRTVGSIPYIEAQLSSTKASVDEHGGVTFNVNESELFAALRYFVPLFFFWAVPSWIMPLYSASIRWRPAFRRNYKTVIDFIDQCAEDRRSEIREARLLGAEPDTAKSLIGMVVEKEGQPDQEQFTHSELRDEALTFFFAGQDTTSAALQWAVKYLAAAPDVQRRLRQELMASLNDSPEFRLLPYADVTSDKTPYLEAVVHETLRCARVAQGVARSTAAEVEILGHKLPKDTDVVFMNSVASRMATKSHAPQFVSSGGAVGLWDDVDVTQFNPDRWLDEAGRFNLKAGYSFPFGIGPRSCAGKQLAMLELRIYIAMLNLAFFFAKLPEALDDTRPRSTGLAVVPDCADVAPKRWSEVA